jgi:hypothetical protein
MTRYETFYPYVLQEESFYLTPSLNLNLPRLKLCWKPINFFMDKGLVKPPAT